MNFKNQTHRIYFAKAVAQINQNDRTLLAAVYLLTADNRLWQNVKKHVHYKEIRFEYICLSGSTENGYTLFCCARDIYMGSKHLSVNDLADARLIPPVIFNVICTALAIARYGLLATDGTEYPTQFCAIAP